MISALSRFRAARALPLVLAAAAGLFLLAACGGGGGGSGGGAPSAGPQLAPSSIAGRTLTFVDPDTPAVTQAFSYSSTTYTSAGGDAGSYTYGKTGGTSDQARLQMVSSFSATLTYQLTFTSTLGGTYIDLNTSKTSTFTISS